MDQILLINFRLVLDITKNETDSLDNFEISRWYYPFLFDKRHIKKSWVSDETQKKMIPWLVSKRWKYNTVENYEDQYMNEAP